MSHYVAFERQQRPGGHLKRPRNTRFPHLATFLPGYDLGGGPSEFTPWETVDHLRFELGEPHPNGTDERVRQSADRAARILEACFRLDDPLLLLITDWGKTFWGGDPAYVYTLVDESAVRRVRKRKLLMTGEDRHGWPRKSRGVHWTIRTQLRSVRYRDLTTAIANTEQGRLPKLTQSVYFVHATRRVAFYMYDDRGCFVFGEVEALRTIRDEFQSWVIGGRGI